MPPKKKGGKKEKGPGNPWGSIQLGSFRASFPQPRLPRLLGSAKSLGVGNSVYPNIRLDVPISQQVKSIVAGALAGSISIDIVTVINQFSSRFASLFKEYAIVGASFELRMNNVVQGAGVVAVYLDETTPNVPTAALALQTQRVDVLVSPQFSAGGSYRIDWTPRDILDLDYVSTGTTFTPLYLKLYTDVTNFNTVAGTTGDVIVTGALAFEFRGYV